MPISGAVATLTPSEAVSAMAVAAMKRVMVRMTIPFVSGTDRHVSADTFCKAMSDVREPDLSDP
ncbi:hypothetical protein GCM10028801_43490 [Nocardioides maradonensis]